MACAVPVVSTDGGALPEVVGDAGIIVPAKNAEALAEAIAGLLADPGRRAILGQAGRQRILERFCWQVCARQMNDYYLQVLADADR
jgi:glycosyltransferase involved in cell wall biosynthesis